MREIIEVYSTEGGAIIDMMGSTSKGMICIIYTRGKGGLQPPSPLVRVAGATLISSEEVVSSELINLFECIVYIKNKLIVS